MWGLGGQGWKVHLLPLSLLPCRLLAAHAASVQRYGDAVMREATLCWAESCSMNLGMCRSLHWWPEQRHTCCARYLESSLLLWVAPKGVFTKCLS